MSEANFLIGDIGGTNARFALANPETFGYQDEQVLRCSDFKSPEAAINTYLEMVDANELSNICLAVAGPVRNNAIDLTNNNWHVRASSLKVSFHVSDVRLINDFEAIACSLIELDSAQLDVIGLQGSTDLAQADFTVGVIGPGTGLGAAALVKRQGHVFPLVTEAGHVGFAPENALQRAVWEVLRDRFGRVSDERLVSGSGLENIYSALSEIHEVASPFLSTAGIFDQVDSNSLAAEAVNLFFEVIGQIAGNFALATGALDGIYIAGGIVQRYPDLLVNSAFRTSFENKGRHRHLMEQVPTLLIKHSHPGLLGASVAARKM